MMKREKRERRHFPSKSTPFVGATWPTVVSVLCRFSNVKRPRPPNSQASQEAERRSQVRKLVRGSPERRGRYARRALAVVEGGLSSPLVCVSRCPEPVRAGG